MIPLYRPGTSILHRLPAGAKLLGVAALALVVSLAPREPGVLAVLCASAVGAYLVGGQGVRGLARQLWIARWVLVFLLVTQLGVAALGVVTSTGGLDWRDALANTVRVVLLVVLAALIALTTPMEALLEAVARAMHPLRRIGIDPDRVSLTISLAITAIPVIAGLADRIREAQRSRGVPSSPRAFLVPLVVMTLQQADGLADALTARGAA